ncbi:unnamed protein product [Penicillium salamii]|uniref:N-acetyltransferase domain-containing protein n=1 Tax=Penicillium salamii TaxID=1612424 RepID=A0A9W4JNK8_9EURO|nr:unnamed protein product [Penicillium salamii]
MKAMQFPGLADQKAFVRPLAGSDLESCLEVESAFPEQERCSKEKFIYRLTVCPEICLGLFEEKPQGAQLIGHVIATRVSANRVTDGSMEMPERWTGSSDTVTMDNQVIGNDAKGRFLGVHSLAIRSEYQGMGLGRALMNEYILYAGQSIESAQSIVIIAHDHLIKFYESFGFKNLGPSPCAFGGGGWYDMVSSQL